MDDRCLSLPIRDRSTTRLSGKFAARFLLSTGLGYHSRTVRYGLRSGDLAGVSKSFPSVRVWG